MGISIVPTLKVLKPAGLLVAVTLFGVLAGFWANAMFYPGTSPQQPINFR